MRVAMAQINSVMGDLKGNLEKIKQYVNDARNMFKADLVAFPEMAVSGYPPLDLLYEKTFVKKNKEMLLEAGESFYDLIGVVGFIDYDEYWNLYNAAAIFKDNRLIGIVHKTLLPTYDVFDEDRYFKSTLEDEIKPLSVNMNGQEVKIGIEICEDLWDENYKIKVTDILSKRGADFIVNISASPFYVGKRFEREKLLKEKAVKNKIPIFYVNLVGGQDELVFDGQSLAVDDSGYLIAYGKPFEEDLIVVDIFTERHLTSNVNQSDYNPIAEMFNALVLGIRDYFRKTGFRKAVLGMSGGIDSSLTACLAVEALGKNNVIGVSMPSKFSSEHSKTDAETLAENLGILLVKFSIQDVVDSYRRILETPIEEVRQHFSLNKDKDDPVADENIQPRVRGNCLMDISNRLKDLRIMVLSTGNKTELALGYCTLYGDMTGGFGALGDVNKLDVYKLAEYVNTKAGKIIIPENVLVKKPSPELKEGQFTPFNFDVVSPLIDEIMENHRSKDELVKMGYRPEVVDDVYNRIKGAEYKRWQAPPFVKITPKAFGMGWKMPIVNHHNV